MYTKLIVIVVRHTYTNISLLNVYYFVVFVVVFCCCQGKLKQATRENQSRTENSESDPPAPWPPSRVVTSPGHLPASLPLSPGSNIEN